MIETIIIAKKNLILILPPPNPKNTPKIFNSLNMFFKKYKKYFKTFGQYNIKF